MVKNKSSEMSARLSEIIVHGMQEKKALDVVRLDLREIHATISDYFVICHADSAAQMHAIAKSVEEEVFKSVGIDPIHTEGRQNGEWILLDYFDIVVHIFRTEKRDHFAIEDLWGDAQVKEYQ